MPVKLEHIHQPSEADWADLNKIQQETTPLGLSQDREQLAPWLDDTHWIIAGRFNDRLIGAVLAQKNPDGSVELTAAGVRTVTQRRGVMHQMMHFIQRWADQENLQLCLTNDCPQAIQDALVRRQFERFADKIIYNPR